MTDSVPETEKDLRAIGTAAGESAARASEEADENTADGLKTAKAEAQKTRSRSVGIRADELEVRLSTLSDATISDLKARLDLADTRNETFNTELLRLHKVEVEHSALKSSRCFKSWVLAASSLGAAVGGGLLSYGEKAKDLMPLGVSAEPSGFALLMLSAFVGFVVSSLLAMKT